MNYLVRQQLSDVHFRGFRWYLHQNIWAEEDTILVCFCFDKFLKCHRNFKDDSNTHCGCVKIRVVE